jgi:hypothetical protein
MRVVAHLLTGDYLPDPGGLAESIHSLARLLSDGGDVLPIVYARGGSPNEGFDQSHPVRVVRLPLERSAWERPLLESDRPPADIASERHRLDFLALRRLISAAMTQAPEYAHVLISFYILNHGFVAQRVADALGLPHIAAIRGTDFSRGFQDPTAFPAIAYVATRAALVVTSNVEQTQACRALGVKNVRMIYSSVRPEYRDSRWVRRNADGRVRLLVTLAIRSKKGRPCF